MAWICLLTAGCLEMVWVTAMKLSEGFHKLGWAALTLVAMVASVWLLGRAAQPGDRRAQGTVWSQRI